MMALSSENTLVIFDLSYFSANPFLAFFNTHLFIVNSSLNRCVQAMPIPTAILAATPGQNEIQRG